MALNIKPLSDRVLIEPVAAETKTASGIFIPDTAKKTKKELLLQLGMAQRTQ
jgi:chaperonin GroES